MRCCWRARAELAGDQVFTLHAELEGMKLLPVLRRLLRGWRAQGYELVSMRTLLAALDVAALPARRVHRGLGAGRSGLLAVQAAAWFSTIQSRSRSSRGG